MLKLLFSRSLKEDADEEEDEVDPEMMIGDEIDTPDEDKAGEPDDEEGFLSLAPAFPGSGIRLPAAAAVVVVGTGSGCTGTCIVLYVKGSAEAEKRYAM